MTRYSATVGALVMERGGHWVASLEGVTTDASGAAQRGVDAGRAAVALAADETGAADDSGAGGESRGESRLGPHLFTESVLGRSVRTGSIGRAGERRTH
jgi:hypothetical protein